MVRELRKRLPAESIIYFGDLAHLPYGIKSRRQITALSLSNIRFLLKHHVKAVVVACNSVSSAAFPRIRREFRVPLVDVLQPAVEEALRVTRTGKIGVIATQATIGSGAYESALKAGRRGVQVTGQACPLFVPLVESAWSDRQVILRVIQAYLRPIIRKRVDTLILGCTHYPLLRRGIQEVLGPRVSIVDSAGPTVQRLTALLDEKGLRSPGKHPGRMKIFVSDMPRDFQKTGERFLGEKLRHIQQVRPLI